MSTLQNRPNTALLVVDVQNGVVARAHEREAVVATIGMLVEKARREQVPVVWVQHSDDELAKGSEGWRIVPELAPHDSEPLVEKGYGDSFEDTNLESVLSRLGVGHHTNLYWSFHEAPGRTAGVVASSDVDFAARQPAAR